MISRTKSQTFVKNRLLGRAKILQVEDLSKAPSKVRNCTLKNGSVLRAQKEKPSQQKIE